MSMNAYRVNEVQYATNASFNLQENASFVDYLEYHSGDDDILPSSQDRLEISVGLLEKALRELILTPKLESAIREDIQWAQAQGVETVCYECF